jgi:hypothetical protein
MTNEKLGIERIFPKWARELERYSPVKSLFFLYKNIYDIYLFPQKITQLSNSNLSSKKDQLKSFCEQSGGRFTLDESLNNVR